jgi:hypothetical protein
MLPKIIDRFINRFRARFPRPEIKETPPRRWGEGFTRIRRAIRDPRGHAFHKLFGGIAGHWRWPRPILARNPSLYNVGDGLRPIGKREFADKVIHFIFPTIATTHGRILGTVNRREIGQGHSSFERFDKREKRRKDFALRRQYKRARRLEACPAA